MMLSRTLPHLLRRSFHTSTPSASLTRVGYALLFTPPPTPSTYIYTSTSSTSSSQIPFAGSEARETENERDSDHDHFNASSWFSFLPFSFPFPLPFTSRSTSVSTASASTASASSLAQWSTTQQRILETALSHVNEYGWTQQAIVKAAEQLGLSPSVAGLFARGPIELVDYYMITNNEKMTAWMRQQPLHQMKTNEKIKLAVRTRLSLQIPLIHTWPQAQGLGALPQNLPYTLHHLAVLVDEMWHLAGDQATDLNWYSKRALLAGVYVSTELFMLSDRSLDYISTWDFLDRRLNDVYQIGKLPKQAESLFKSVVNNGSSLFQTLGQQVRQRTSDRDDHSSRY